MSQRNPNLIDKLSRLAPQSGLQLLQSVVDLADRRSLTAYLVGGPVRDLILDRPFTNADVSIEGDATALAADLAARPDLRVVTHKRFLTAAVHAHAFVLDLVTARSETYARPGALPDVTPATIDDDLRRRDFTVHAIALALNGPHRGDIIDPAEGCSDLQRRLIRVLHDRSFRDDATRILRAARYESRLDFRLDPETEHLLRRDVSFLDTISPARIHHEFARTFDEARPEHTFRRLDDLGALAAVHPALNFPPARVEAFARLRSLAKDAARSAYWPLLAWDVPRSSAATLGERLALRRTQAEAVAAVPDLRDLESTLSAPGLKPTRIVELLSPFPRPAVWALAAAATESAPRDAALDYLRTLRHVTPELNGRDLIAMGVPEGPKLGQILYRLRAARLDGDVRGRDDEKRLARSIISASG